MTFLMSVKQRKNEVIDWKLNNFDLIRLLAAIQVALKHAMYHLDFFPDYMKKIIDVFPGVPIFFFISGFLIYRSYEKNRTQNFHLYNFFLNRCLRLYPALLCCFVFSCVIMIHSGYLNASTLQIKDLLQWAFTSLTVFQFYNPPFLRDFGVGAINGSLWSISVEIQFYLLTPVMFVILSRRFSLIFLLLAFFVCFNVFYSASQDTTGLIFKLFSASFLPWFCYFFFGAIVSKYFHIWCCVINIPLWVLLLAHTCVWQSSVYLNLEWDGSIYPIGFLMLSICVTKFAYLHPPIKKQASRGNDISYGIYIYHMPIINYFVFTEQSGLSAVVFSLCLTVCLAATSWFMVEKPALKLKKRSFY